MQTGDVAYVSTSARQCIGQRRLRAGQDHAINDVTMTTSQTRARR
jgi:hypothetical protein